MTIRALPIPKRLTLFLAALAALAAPASATIQFSYCSSGCSSTGGSYSAWDTATGSSGLVFSGSPITFSPGGLSSGIYTDGTGTVFTGYSNATTIDSLTLSGAALTQTINGSNSGIQISLPSNTYAIAFWATTVSGHAYPMIELGDRNLNNANYQLIIPSSTSPQFFGILSDTPLTSLFIGDLGGSDGILQIQSLELGQNSSAATPEISSLAFIGTGLLLFGLLLRRRGLIQKPNRSLA